eukprot:4436364-Pyramimonas_sp.AAC.1
MGPGRAASARRCWAVGVVLEDERRRAAAAAPTLRGRGAGRGEGPAWTPAVTGAASRWPRSSPDEVGGVVGGAAAEGGAA